MIALRRAILDGRITRATLPRDALAGLVVGIVAIPLAMAFAIASGLKPEQGLATGIVAGVVVSVLGGSQVQIAGPTGAFIVILARVVAEHGVAGLLVATAMAGVVLIGLGVARLGRVIQFIPHPVTMGFTAGIAVIIFTGQVHHFFGIRREGNPTEFVHMARALVDGAGTASWPTAAIALVTLAAILLVPRVTRRVPSTLVAMLLGTAVYLLWRPEGVRTIGHVPSALPAFALPDYDWSRLGVLVAPAFTIAMLGAIESLLSAVVADGMTGDTHDPNQELIGQGIANVATPFLGGFAATGAIARTATNVRNGCRSPVGGLVHSLVLVATVVLLAPYATHVPLASLAAILFVVAWNMSEAHQIVAMLRSGSRSDVLVLLVTFALTVFVDLVVAVNVGVVLAALLFLKHVSEHVEVKAVLGTEAEADRHHGVASSLPREIAVFSIDGPFFFGVARRFESTVAAVDPVVRVVIVRLWKVPYLDASGVNSLRRVVHALRRGGRTVLLSGIRPEVHEVLAKSGLEAEVGEDRVWPTIEEALACARDVLVDERLAGRGPGGAVRSPAS